MSPRLVSTSGASACSLPSWRRSSSIRRFEDELALADRVIAQSTFALRVLIAHAVSPDKIDVLPTGVDTGRFRPVPRDARPRRSRVLYVGRLEYRKGLRFLGEAVTPSRSVTAPSSAPAPAPSS